VFPFISQEMSRERSVLVTFATNTITLLPQIAGKADWSDVRAENK
jgi:hypothetical protein